MLRIGFPARIYLYTCLLVFGALPVAALEDDSPKESSPTEKLLAEIGSPDWRKREAATWSLMNLGTEIYPDLEAAYKSTHSFEIKKRIKEIAREIFVANEIGPAPAFLGIGHDGARTTALDGRIPLGETALVINEVYPLTAADRAGIRVNDVWLEMNGQRTSDKIPADEFTAWIAKQRPGTRCEITVMRGGTGFVLDKRSLPGFDPRGFRKIGVKVKTIQDDPRIPPARVALEISDAERADARLKLEDKDLILGLDNKPFTNADDATARFKKWKAGEELEKPALLPEGVFQLLQGNQIAAISKGPSAHIIRGGRILQLQVVLGRKPAVLQFRGEERRMELGLAEASFETWWEAHFMTARSNESLESEFYWRADP